MIGDHLHVVGGRAVTLLVAVSTDFPDGRPFHPDEVLVRAAELGHAELRERHLAARRSAFRPLALDIAPDGSSRPTDERLAALTGGGVDDDLLATHFDLGRHLLHSSSRPGTQAANLQGIWNESFTPAWDSKFTTNINVEMNYWPAEVAALADAHDALFDLIDRGQGHRRGDCADPLRSRRFRRSSQSRHLGGHRPARQCELRIVADRGGLAGVAPVATLGVRAR